MHRFRCCRVWGFGGLGIIGLGLFVVLLFAGSLHFRFRGFRAQGVRLYLNSCCKVPVAKQVLRFMQGPHAMGLDTLKTGFLLRDLI